MKSVAAVEILAADKDNDESKILAHIYSEPVNTIIVPAYMLPQETLYRLMHTKEFQ